MVLKALELQGFKSFPDKLRITFDKGITGVVGPNGSGKSNISDAIRWVLGETSAKQLRGGGKMENVIFGGTTKRSPMGFASVRLVLDNSDRLLDVDADEVTVGRRYYRSGESEYTINGAAVRLKDVYEMFLDTGLGRDGYSIIGQGRIAEIVSGKSEERREIFEEASGIARYRYRKNEAEKRLEASEENLVRLRDILGELEGRVGPLEKESKKAQSFLTLSAERKKLEITLWLDTVRRAKETVRDQQRKMEIAQSDYDADSARIDRLDAESEQVRAESERYITAMDAGNRAIRSISEEMAGSEARIAVLKNDISHNESAIASLKEKMAASDAGDAELEKQVRACEDAAADCEKKIAGFDAFLREKETQLSELTKQSEASGERRGKLAAEMTRLTQQATEHRVELASAASAGEAAVARLNAALAAAQEGQEKRAELERDTVDTRAFDEKLRAEITRLSNIKNGLSIKAASRAAAKQKAEEASAAVAHETETAAQRLKVLHELERSMEGYQNSVKSVMRAAESHRLRGVIGTVASVLRVKSGYELAVETALGAALQNVVVQNETAAKAAIAYLKEERAGRATFLPLDTVQPQSLRDARLGDAVEAVSVVEYDPKYENIARSLLGRIVITEDINEASDVARRNGYHFRVVSKDGQVVNAGGSFTGGFAARSAGLFSRRQEISELERRLTGLDARAKAALADVHRASQEAESVAAELTATESELITAKGDQIRSGMELSRLTTALAQQTEALAQLETECSSLRAAAAEAEERGEAARTALTRAEARTKELEAEMKGLEGNDTGFVESREKLSAELGEARLSRLACEKDAELHRQNAQALRGRTGQSRQLQASRQANIARLGELIAASNADIAAIGAQRAEAEGRIKEKEEAIRQAGESRVACEGRQNALAAERRTAADHREEMGREVARLTERRDALEKEYEAAVSKLWEEYELTLTDAAAWTIEFDNVTELRRQVTEVRAKIKGLGSVNVGAIDEYAEVSARYTFMKEQVADVEKAKAQLTRMITELSGEMKEIFTKNFAVINENFGRIFAELFGGGTARLTLTDPEDVLGSGIEIEVAPPGKIIKNLASLSGGEQALVAVSIYFAILAVNPSPFCVLDEIEAALDDVNVVRYAQYLRRITDRTQFIVITHRRGTMEEADVLYGVTMQEDGVSKVLRLDTNNVDVSMIGGKPDGTV